MPSVEVVVVGGGIMGASTAWALAARGHEVMLLERFTVVHDRGSSHAETRIFRLGYDEADYIHLGQQALAGWRRLERATGADLLRLTGALDHGPAATIDALAAAMDDQGVPHRRVDPSEAARTWPAMAFDEAVLVHPDGGMVFAERSVVAAHEAAHRHGATVRTDSAVVGIEVEDAGTVLLLLAGGDRIRATQVVVTAGAWAGSLLGGLVDLPPLQVSAEQPMYFRRRDGVAPLPPFIHRGQEDIYGLDSPARGTKVAEHYRDEWLDPDVRPFDADPASAARTSDYVRRWMPGLDPEPIGFDRCLYTTTPTKDFVLDRVGPITVGAGFSGHGFKFSPAVGEVLADLVEGATQPTARFRLSATRVARRSPR